MDTAREVGSDDAAAAAGRTEPLTKLTLRNSGLAKDDDDVPRWDNKSPLDVESPHNICEDFLLPVAMAAVQEEVLSAASDDDDDDDEQIPPAAQDHHQPSAFKLRSSGLAVRTCWRLKWSMESMAPNTDFGRLANHYLRGQLGSPLRHRWRACVWACVSVARLRITLPRIKAKRQQGLSLLRHSTKWIDHNATHCFRSAVFSVLFSVCLSSSIRRKHLALSPLSHALSILSSASKIKLDDSTLINAGKGEALLRILSISSTYLSMVRPVLEDIVSELQHAEGSSSSSSSTSSFKRLSACHYSLKDLCRLLIQCLQYLQDCSGNGPSRKVFAKLESLNTLQFILGDFNSRLHLFATKVEELVAGSNSPSAPCSPALFIPAGALNLSGSYLDHYLKLQAESDLSKALSKLQNSLKPFWHDFLSWIKILTPAEEISLRKHLFERLKYDRQTSSGMAENSVQNAEEIALLKHGLGVDRRNVKLVKFRGGGSYGTVWEVVCFGERYAMKSIESIEEIENAKEATIQARLHHPHIVKLVWYTTDVELVMRDDEGGARTSSWSESSRGGSVPAKRNLCFLMELMDMGLDIYLEQRSYQRKAPLSKCLVLAVAIMLQIAEAMKYLHSEGVMHRDLKSSNVLVDLSSSPEFKQEGYFHIKLCDFGLAKVKEAGAQASSNTAKVGTKYWRAPEVLKSASGDEAAQYSFSADVYSYAMTSYEILTGKQPFTTKDHNLSGLRERIAGVPGERPVLPEADMPPALVRLIKECWHTSPSARPTFKAICFRLQVITEELLFGTSH